MTNNVYCRLGCNIPARMVALFGMKAIRTAMRTMPPEWVDTALEDKDSMRKAATQMSGEKNYICLVPPETASALRAKARRLYSPVILSWCVKKIKEEQK